MDSIIQSYLDKFEKEHQLTNGKDHFESFINYCVLSNSNISNLKLTAVQTGSGNDCGIDGLAISVSGKYITDITELSDLINFRVKIDIKFHFIQSKKSNNFDGSEILTFGAGVVDVFDPVGTKVRNEQIEEKSKMIQLILKNYDLLEKQPECLLYYVTTGKWVGDQNLTADLNKVINDLEKLDIFSSVKLFPLGSKEIRELFQATRLQNIAEFSLHNKIEIPYINGIDEAYFALVPAKELVSIISDNDSLKKGIFESNIRDFQGYDENRVNQDILKTIKSVDRNQFGLLNNGVTIVGKSISRNQGKYIIRDFQVVNGCQTSNMLYLNKELIDDDMWVSIKLVITNDDQIINKIVKATNNQTEVEEIQLYAMTDYQHLLESFFNTYSFKNERLFFERRLGQYNSSYEIDKLKIVSFEEQLKSFSAVFLDSPHKSSRYFKTVIEEIEKKIFIDGHEPIIYFTSSFINYRIEKCLVNEVIEDKFKKFKYHLMMILRKMLTNEVKTPPLNSKKIIQYCEDILEAIHDENKFVELLERAVGVLSSVLPNLNSTEANKSSHYVNLIHMYLDLDITEQNLKIMKSFNYEMDGFSVPFHNVRIDGDLRYNLTKWLDDTAKVLTRYNFNGLADSFYSLKNELDENSRISRKGCANKAHTLIKEIMEMNTKKIEASKRYYNVNG